MKAILVIDMPKSCAKCPLITRYGQEYICPSTKCDINGMDAPLARMRFCSLRPLPDKRPEEKNDWGHLTQKENAAMNHGWNKCLDAITGGKEA